MPQEELDRFPQRRLAEFSYRLRVLLDGHMQRVTWRENFPRRNEAFQFRCRQIVNFHQSSASPPSTARATRLASDLSLKFF